MHVEYEPAPKPKTTTEMSGNIWQDKGEVGYIPYVYKLITTR